MATERLYESDAYLFEFDAEAVAATELPGGRWGIELTRTAFYPGGGGQPPDRGTLGDAAVLDMHEEGGRLLHVTDRPVPPGPVRGAVDRARRLDHMRQHTGQHLLSAAFHELFGAPTVGFHLGETESTIDLRMDALSPEEAARAERLANAAVLENRATAVHLTDAEGVRRFPVRKMPAKAFGRIRLVEIPGADVCPCGGTHLRSTGEVGLVKIVSRTKRGGEFRIAFLCGERAIADYGKRVAEMERAGETLSAPPEGIAQAARTLRERFEEAAAGRKRAEAERNELLAERLAARAQRRGAFRIATASLERAEPQTVADLANGIARHGGTVALVGGVSPDGAKVHLAFAASAGVEAPIDVAAILRQALPEVAGRGGGTARFAQGGGTLVSGLPACLERAAKTVAELPVPRFPAEPALD